MDEFDSLRREATKLERHLEDRVARYQQLAQKFNPNASQSTTTTPSSNKNGSSILLDSMESGTANGGTTATTQEEENSLRNDIQRTLSNLGDLINHKLSPAADRSSKSQHLLLVKRYREILFDLTGDFQKASSTLNRKREQAELFRGANGTNNNGGGDSSQQDPAMEALLRERSHIQNSINTANDVLGQASDIYGDLRNQGMSLRGVSSTILKITSNVPGLNRLVENIRRKRNMDDKIVAGVIAACILFTLWYLFG
mmetsp:Transcript_18673/g.26341  ORF Transcript_18673/g.26341 Transcript_18673/m.26341 type:complete len:256 (-) Transcript_18673:239-1006(-)